MGSGFYVAIAAALLLYLLAVCAGAIYSSGRWTPSSLPRVPRARWFLLAFAVAVVAGQASVAGGSALAFAFAVLPAAVLAPLAVVAFVVRGLNRPVSWGHATAAIVLGSLFSTVVAILLEGAALAPIAIPIALGGGSADIYSPAVRFVLVLAAATVTAPLAEEFSKGLGMVLLRRRIGGASGAFVVGVSTGAGFAIVEDFGYYSLDPSFRSWSMFALVRGVGGILHPLTSGLVALGIYGVLGQHPRAWRRLAGFFALAAGVHGLWNLLPGIGLGIGAANDPDLLLGGDESDFSAVSTAEILVILIVGVVIFAPKAILLWRILAIVVRELRRSLPLEIAGTPPIPTIAPRPGPVSRASAFLARQVRTVAQGPSPVPNLPARIADLRGPFDGEESPIRRAGFWRRFTAFAFDWFIATVIFSVFGVGAVMASRTEALLVTLLVFPAYFIGLPLLLGTTPGKIALGIAVAGDLGDRISRRRMLFRELVAKPLSALGFFVGYLWVVWDPEKQAWHDMLAGTFVVSSPDGRGASAGAKEPESDLRT